MNKLNIETFIPLKLIAIYFFALLTFILFPHRAEAGTIINRPIYLGLNQGLVGYWSFDGPDMSGTTALDRSGNGNNGTLTNGPTMAIGKLGQGVNLDGSNDYVSIGNVAIVDGATQMTASIWTKYNVKNGLTSEQHLFNRSNCTGMVNSGVFEIVGGVDPGTGGATDGKVSIVVMPTGEAHANSGVSNIRIDDGNWHLITGVYDGARVQIYVDGNRENSAALANKTLASPSTPMQIGVCNAIRQWNGSVDDVRIYNRALSPTEIRRLYQIGSTTKVNATPKYLLRDSSLVGYWTFNATETGTTSAKEITGDADKTAYLKNGAHYASGILGQGVEFDGVDDYMSAPADDDLNLITHETVSAWIYKRSNNGSDSIVTKWHDPGATFYTEMRTLDTELQYTPGGGADTNHRTTGLNLQTGQWYHVVGVHDDTNNRAKMYVNGVEVYNSSETQAGGQGSASVTGELYIGAYATPTDFFDGKIDDLRIYIRPLSPDEIKRLYRIGKPAHLNATPKHQLTQGLVGYWSFDGPDMSGTTAFDRSPGNANNGTLTNGPVRAIGKLGQALSFDGSDDYVDVGSPAALDNLSSLTLSAWIYPRSFSGTNGGQHIVSKNTFATGWALSTSTGSCPNRLQFNVFFTGIDLIALAPNNSVTTNRWRHLVVVWTGGTTVSSVTFFLDGIKLSDADCGGNQNSSGTPEDDSASSVAVASGRSDQASPFDGLIDDVRIYNRALSPSEVRRLYQMGR